MRNRATAMATAMVMMLDDVWWTPARAKKKKKLRHFDSYSPAATRLVLLTARFSAQTEPGESQHHEKHHHRHRRQSIATTSKISKTSRVNFSGARRLCKVRSSFFLSFFL